MRTYEIISTLFFMALGVWVAIGGWRLQFGEWKNPGPGFIPVLSGILIFLLSALWLVMTLVKKWGMGERKIFFSEPGSSLKVILSVLALVFYAILLDRVGFMISTFVLLIFLFRAIEPQSWKISIAMAFIVTFFCVFCFQVWLQVQFPEGLFSIYLLRKWIY